MQLSGEYATETTAALWSPGSDVPKAVFVFGHGGRAKGRTPSELIDQQLAGIASGLCDRGHAVLAFNFPYSERGWKQPDPPSVLESVFRDAMKFAAGSYGRPIVLGGRSMGALVASRLASNGADCIGLCLLAYPLHPPLERGGRVRVDHWDSISQPVLFVQGELDNRSDQYLWHRLSPRLRGPVGLKIIPGGNHQFSVPGRNPEDVRATIATLIADWVVGVLQ
jgi:predicted alpha/beta-hydrolase family hydrolase